MLTHLVHFHIRGAQPTAAASQATYGWAQGHFLGAYLGAGANETSPALDTFTAGWAQGHALAPYLGSGVNEASPALDTFTAGWSRGSWLAYYYGAGASAQEIVTEAEKLGGPRDTVALRDRLLREDEEILMFIAAWTEMQ